MNFENNFQQQVVEIHQKCFTTFTFGLQQNCCNMPFPKYHQVHSSNLTENLRRADRKRTVISPGFYLHHLKHFLDEAKV